MSGKLIMTKGLPGSGKSTWATSVVENKAERFPDGRPIPVIIVNKDDLRAEIRKEWNYDVEQEVLRLRDKAICEGLSKGYIVISSDTNFDRHERRLRGLATKYKASFEIKSFCDVPLEVCIERDSGREASVGAKVIMAMHDKWLAQKVSIDIETVEPIDLGPYVPDESKPNAIICDLDGTLAIHNGRNPYATELCGTDILNDAVYSIVCMFEANGHEILYVSGREEKFRDLSKTWLVDNFCPSGHLYMRPTGDTRNDAIVKREIFDTHIRAAFNVRFVLDDRDRVVKMWRELDLTCLQVNYGNF